MAIFTEFMYNYVFIYFCLPAFVLMLFGRPRFLVRKVRNILDIKLPKIGFSIGTILMFACIVIVATSYLKKNSTEKQIAEIKSTVENETYYNEKLREAHLSERNCYMYFTFTIMILVLQRMCGSYEKLWELEDKYYTAIKK
jgi:hypothetical protein